MAVQIWFTTYAIAGDIGTDKAESVDDIASDIALQQAKDLDICLLALFIGGF